MRFLKWLGSFFTIILASIVTFIFMIFFIVGGIKASVEKIGQAPSEKLKPHTFLVINFNKDVSEKSNDDPIETLIKGGDASLGLVQFRKGLQKAARDYHIRGIVLKASTINMGMATITEVRNAIKEYKKSGKKVYAYADVMTEKSYFLNSIADTIIMNPYGMFEFNGLSSTRVFVSGLLEKIGIEPMIFKVGKFKSAVEPLIRKEMSDSARLQTQVLLNDQFDVMLESIADERGLNIDSLKNWNRQFLIQDPRKAREYGLIDIAGYFGDMLSLLHDEHKLPSSDVNMISFDQYFKENKILFEKKPSIRVIVLEGEIHDGNAGQGIPGRATANLLREAASDSTVLGVVLRINSPGGSSLASENIWQEVELLKNQKPVIASMGDLAASGGYYISAPCTRIVANPNTITGSIGVFGVMLNTEKLFTEKLGITFDRVGTSKYADFPSTNRPMTEDEKNIIQNSVNEIYDLFVSRVAKGRSMEDSLVRKIGEGRVWSGRKALEIGLVDTLGDFSTALNMLYKMTGKRKNEVKVDYYPKKKSFMEKIFNEEGRKTMAEAREDFLKSKLPSPIKTWVDMYDLSQKRLNFYTRLPYLIEVE